RGQIERLSDRSLQQHIGGGDTDRAAVAAMTRVGEPPVRDPALDADPVAAERVHVLEGGVRPLQAPLITRMPEALANEIAVDHVANPVARREPRSVDTEGSATRCPVTGARHGRAPPARRSASPPPRACAAARGRKRWP